jgi:hypothetical protein
MKSPIRLVMLGAAVWTVLILVFSPAPAGQNAAQVKKVEAQVKGLAPDVLRRLTAPTSREVILESIKSLPRPAAPLTRAAGPSSPPVKMQMRQGTGKGKSATTSASAGAAQVAATSTGYEKIDWKAGVFISPFSVPRYGTGNWPAAMITTSYIDYMKTQDPGLVVLDWATDGQSGYWLYKTITVELELPQEAGLYTIALKMVRTDGMCAESWFSSRTKCGSFPLYVYLSGHTVPMTKLIDDSGFVGIINFEPGPPEDGSYYGLRQYNAYIEVNVTTWGYSQSEPLPRVGPLAFAGILITRLQ